ncbi:MAG: peptidoglycan DD-metalloendopeptidase family protein [Azoarcus sp.]|jgi:lipoprotein NlpD|nr:peptidoglycan DD-metalloendopeptidase family protein [Azoarcus sp.]
MNTETFVKRLALAGLAGLFVGCAHTENAPVRDARHKAAARTPAAQTAAARPGEHVVRQGETLYAISRRYGVSVQELAALNKLARPEQLEAGQTLKISRAHAADVETIPVAPLPPGATAVAELPVVKREPRGGKEAYSDEAWARLRSPGVAPEAAVAPAGTPAANAAARSPSTQTPAAAQPPVAAQSGGNWIWPVKGEIIAAFNDSAEGGAKLRNRGIDIAGAPGTPIVAAAGGKVIYAGSAVRGMGMMLIVKHDDNYLTAYAHNRTILVKESDTVAQGQKIAELGNTDADRPKLHFELRKQGQPVDPLKYLPPL